MDIYTFIVLLHVVGTILGTGGATIAELQITRAIGDKKVSPDERALLHVNYGLIRVGMGILLVSVIAMYWYFATLGDDVLFTDEKLWTKELMFVAIFVNALALHKRWIPLWLGASISFTSWWSATLLGVAREMSYPFGMYLIGYIVAIFVFAGLFAFIRVATKAKLLTPVRQVILISGILLLILFTLYSLIKTEEAAREVKEGEESSANTAIYRTLEETATFAYPGGSHTIRFSFTLDPNGTISAVAAADVNPQNQGKIAEFVTNVSNIVVGQEFATLVPLSRVGGSSLTTTAFNEAVAKLQARETQ